MNAQRRLGLTLSWARVSPVFLIDVAVLVLVSHWPEAWRRDIAWWTGVGIAVVVAVLALLTYRRVPLSTLLVAWVRNRFTDIEATLTAGRTPPVDHRRRFGRAVVGLREYRGAVVAVVAVDAPAEAAPGRHSQHEAVSAELPVHAVAAGLRQFDVRLDGIDIVSVRTRTAEPGAAEPSADAPRAGAGERRPRTWLVLRMDPQRNVAALAARDSVAATLAAVAERLAEDLGRRRFAAWPLTAAEIADLDATVLGGLHPADSSLRLRYLRQLDGAGYVTALWVSPGDLGTEMFDRLWLPDVDTTVVTVRLTPRHGRVDVSAWVRYHSAERLAKEARRGLNRLVGRQLAAVEAGLPVPAQSSPLVFPGRVLSADDPLAVPLRPYAAAPVDADR